MQAQYPILLKMWKNSLMNKLKVCAVLVITYAILSCTEKFSQGELIYKAQCANCHMDDGSGLKSLIPSIVKSKYIVENNLEIVCLLQHGINADSLGKSMRYMPPFYKLSDVEVTNLINFLRNKHQVVFEEVSLEMVKKTRQVCD